MESKSCDILDNSNIFFWKSIFEGNKNFEFNPIQEFEFKKINISRLFKNNCIFTGIQYKFRSPIPRFSITPLS